ncbi:MAG TPA: PilZ domain-containing protein [Desulfobacteraceae bacterium]|nr:PilZ domain-containing protein [Desulfobacteraceae bacterium]
MSQNRRTENRKVGGKNSSVEFKPDNAGVTYQFKLRDFSTNGLGFLVNEGSKVLELISVGDEMEMKYYPRGGSSVPLLLKTRINHISPPEKEKHQNHYIIGLHILE